MLVTPSELLATGKYDPDAAVALLQSRGATLLVAETKLRLTARGHDLRSPMRRASAFMSRRRASLIVADGVMLIGMRSHLFICDWPGASDPAAGAVDVFVGEGGVALQFVVPAMVPGATGSVEVEVPHPLPPAALAALPAPQWRAPFAGDAVRALKRI